MDSIDEFKEIKFILKENNPYLILGVNDSATTNEITRTYKSLAKRYHPDKFSFLSDKKKINDINLVFSKIKVAYEKLSKHEERRKIDKILKNDSNKELNNSQKIDKNLEQKINSNITKNSSKEKENIPFEKTIQNNKKIKLKNDIEKSNSINNLKESPILFTKAYQSKNNFLKENANKLFNQGKLLLKKKEYELAINSFQKAIDMDQKNASYHSHLGLAMKLKGWEGYAQAQFKMALFHDKENKIAKQYYKPSKKRNKLNDSSNLFDKFVDGLLKRMKK